MKEGVSCLHESTTDSDRHDEIKTPHPPATYQAAVITFSDVCPAHRFCTAFLGQARVFQFYNSWTLAMLLDHAGSMLHAYPKVFFKTTEFTNAGACQHCRPFTPQPRTRATSIPPCGRTEERRRSPCSSWAACHIRAPAHLHCEGDPGAYLRPDWHLVEAINPIGEAYPDQNVKTRRERFTILACSANINTLRHAFSGSANCTGDKIPKKRAHDYSTAASRLFRDAASMMHGMVLANVQKPLVSLLDDAGVDAVPAQRHMGWEFGYLDGFANQTRQLNHLVWEVCCSGCSFGGTAWKCGKWSVLGSSGSP